MTKLQKSTKIMLVIYLVIIIGTILGLGGYMTTKIPW